MDTVTLENERLKAIIEIPGSRYARSRYDWTGIVRQITLDGNHTFLSGEKPGALDGVGLSSVIEWADTTYFDETAAADYFPMLGIGLLKRADTLPFDFTKDYAVIPFQKQLDEGKDWVTMRSLPQLSHGVAVDESKKLSIDGTTLTITYAFKNVGNAPVHATEFIHNFFRFDAQTVNDDYELTLPYTIGLRLRRGELIISPTGYRLGEFDGATRSSAFFLSGFEGLGEHWMKLTHRKTGLSILIEDKFPAVKFYGWNTDSAFCPETFAAIDLEPGESQSYTRAYTFSCE